MRAGWGLLLVALVALIAIPGPAAAAPGGLIDSTFGSNGIAQHDVSLGGFDDNGNAVAVQPDGRILVAGMMVADATFKRHLAVVRLTRSGALDPTWSGDGIALLTLAEDAEAKDVELMPDGRVVVAGSYGASPKRFLVARFMPDGTPDPNWNLGAPSINPVGTGSAIAHGVAVQADGRVIAVGEAMGSGKDLVSVRYAANGSSLDTTWDGDGIRTEPLTTGNDIAYDVAITAAGLVYVTGVTVPATGQDLVVVRYGPTGTLDGGWSGDGILADVSSGPDGGHSITLDADELPVVTGFSTNPTQKVALWRFNASGTMLGAVSTHAPGGFAAAGRGVDVDSAGRYVVAGFANSSPMSVFVLRFTSSGALDTSWGSGGETITGATPNAIQGWDVAFDSNDRAVVAGYAQGAGNDFFAIRYQADTPPASDGTAIGMTGCMGPDIVLGTFGPGAGGTSGSCTVTFGNPGDSAMLRMFQADGAGPALVGANGTYFPNYMMGDWASTGSSFGACLSTVGGPDVVAVWSTNLGCPRTDGAGWNGVAPTAASAGSTIARSVAPGVDKSATVMFGARVGPGQVAGDYAAILDFEVVSPG